MSDQNKIFGSPGTDAPPCGSRDVAGVVATAPLTTEQAAIRHALATLLVIRAGGPLTVTHLSATMGLLECALLSERPQ